MIVGQEIQALLALVDIPTNITVSRRATPGGRTEEQAGQRTAMAVGKQIGHILADRLLEAQIVIMGQQPGE